jgi:hypothetical protein
MISLSKGREGLETYCYGTSKHNTIPRSTGLIPVETPISAILVCLLYAHGDMYGSVTVTQGSPYISNAVTHPRCMCWRANFSEVAQISPKSGFPGDLCA